MPDPFLLRARRGGTRDSQQYDQPRRRLGSPRGKPDWSVQPGISPYLFICQQGCDEHPGVTGRWERFE